MKIYLKRIIKAILLVGVIAFVFVYHDVYHKGIPLEQVLTVRFWILAILHLIPAYFMVWTSEDNMGIFQGRVIWGIIAFVWFIFLGIIWAVVYLLFGYDLLGIV